jgi:hypothetical protein
MVAELGVVLSRFAGLLLGWPTKSPGTLLHRLQCPSARHEPHAVARESFGPTCALDTRDLRSGSDRFKWPISCSHNAPLLERALSHLGTDWRVRTRSATRIVDRRESNDDYPWHLLPAQTWRQAGTRPPGALRYGPRGRVLSVC